MSKNNAPVPDHKIQEFITEYTSGSTVPQLCEKHGISETTISKYLKLNGVVPRGTHQQTVITKEIIDQVLGMHMAGSQIKDIHSVISVGKNTIGRIISESGLKSPRQLEIERAVAIYDADPGISIEQIQVMTGVGSESITTYIKRRDGEIRRYLKVRYNLGVFDNPSTELAYHMGFGIADGNIDFDRRRRGSRSYGVCIHEKDICVLHDFCKVFGTDIAHIRHKQKVNQVRIRISGNDLCARLAEWGIVQNKTYDYVRTEIPKHLIKPFLIGFIDGDGSIYAKDSENSNRNVARVAMVGNDALIDYIIELFRLVGYDGHISQSKIDETDVYKRISVNGLKNCFRLLDLLDVRNTSFYLKRKWDPLIRLADKYINKDPSCLG